MTPPTIDHNPNRRPPDDRRNLWICITFVISAGLIAGLMWFLKQMSLEFVSGALFGGLLMTGLIGIMVKDFRNLP